MNELIFRRFTLLDSRDLFEWRNDPDSRKASTNTALVDWESHEQWLSLKLDSLKSAILIFELAADRSNKIGMTRIDINQFGNKAEISINLNPIYRGKGLAFEMLVKSVSYFFEDFPSLHTITAVVKRSNIPSIKIFTAVGFSPDSVSDDLIEFQINRR